MNARTIKVLLIGNDDDCGQIGEWLRVTDASHFELSCVVALEEGVRAVTTSACDVILIDSQMGISTGLDLLQALSREFETPVILLADEEDYEVDVAATHAGASDYLVKKHLNAPLLERAIRYAVEGKRVQTAWRRALRENNRLSAAITNLSTGVVITDAYHPDNPIIFANAAVTQHTGYSRDEIIGRNCRFLQGPETDPAARRAMREAIAAHRSFEGEVLNYRKDGTPFWNALTITPLEEHGEIINYVGLVNDVSERRSDEARLRNSQAQLAEAQRIAHLGSWYLNLVDDSVSWSDEMYRIYGREPDGLPITRTRVRGWIHPDDLEHVYQTALHSRQSLEPFEGYHRAVRPDGEVRVVHHRGVVLADDKNHPIAMNGTVQDVTELKAAEAALQHAHDELENRVEERTEQLRARAERLRNVNHELLALARLATVDGALPPLLREFTEAAARAMFVARSSIWLFLEDRSGLRCLDLFARPLDAPETLEADCHSSGGVLLERDYPNYFETLKTERSIAVQDACHDARTDEFCDGYLTPLGITSMLDAPIIKGGELVGVVCLEHVGEPREWTLEEETFAGSLADLVALALETVERRQAETALRSSEERTRLIIQTAQDAYIAMDTQSTVIDWNPRAEEIFGWSREEALGKTVSDLIIPPQFRAIHEEGMRNFVAYGSDPQLNKRLEVTALDKSGREFPTEMTVSPMRWGDNSIISFFIQDITDRKQAEAALRAAKEEAERAREEAERARVEAETANRAKSEFLSRMSHELRTPLNSILGFGQLLQRNDLTQKQSEYLELILSGGHHLLDLINEVLDLARVESGRLSLSIEPVRVCDIIAETMSLAHPLAERRNIVLVNEVSDETLFVAADRQRFKQVLLNLLSNGVKYNHDGGRVRVWCEPAPAFDSASGPYLQIKVSNTGAGIAPEKLPRLFLPFERLDADGEIEGTGLGLALSKRLMEAMGGVIHAQSTPDVETILTCVLPQSEAPKTSATDASLIKIGGLADGLRVLYIEDNLVNLKLVESLFADIGQVELMTAMQGQLGLDLAREHRPDLILIDLHLPGMEGDEVLQRLQTDPEMKSTPVIILSADATVRQIERLLALGARRYLTKPFNVEEFLRVIQEVIKEIQDEKSEG